ncbi:hypothetical protein [Vibrio kagoshimensis]
MTQNIPASSPSEHHGSSQGCAKPVNYRLKTLTTGCLFAADKLV